MRTTIILFSLLVASTPLFAQGRGGSRNPWDRVSQMDADGDGKVSRDEFTGPDRFWDRLDGDGDGFVTEEEAKNMRRGNRGGMRGGQGQGGMGGGLTQRLDTDKDGKVSAEEWQAFFKTADKNGDGFLTNEEFMGAMGGGREGGRGRRDNPPKVGTEAPKVAAKKLVGGEMVDLAKPERTTVLVFGSYT